MILHKLPKHTEWCYASFIEDKPRYNKAHPSQTKENCLDF